MTTFLFIGRVRIVDLSCVFCDKHILSVSSTDSPAHFQKDGFSFEHVFEILSLCVCVKPFESQGIR